MVTTYFVTDLADRDWSMLLRPVYKAELRFDKTEVIQNARGFSHFRKL